MRTARSGAGKIKATALENDIAEVESLQTFNQFLERAVPVLATIPTSVYDAVLEALGNPATVESLAALNKLATARKKSRLRVLPKPKG